MAAAAKLDRKRSYGTVYGDPNIGFFQDELPYRHDGTLHPSALPAPPKDPAPPDAASFPSAASVPTANDIPVLQALEALSSQIKELKPEPPEPAKTPDPARSELMRKIWVERRAREAAAAAQPEPAAGP